MSVNTKMVNVKVFNVIHRSSVVLAPVALPTPWLSEIARFRDRVGSGGTEQL